MPNAMKQPIRTHLSAEEQERLGQEATARGISISQCIRECLAEYFALRAEVATAFETPGRPGEPRTGLIHTLLARTEARLVATLETCAEAVDGVRSRSEEHTSELQSHSDLVCRLLLEKKKKKN